MNDRTISKKALAKSQFLIATGATLFCVGSVITQPWWWVKAVFGLFALVAATLAWMFGYYAWGKDGE